MSQTTLGGIRLALSKFESGELDVDGLLALGDLRDHHESGLWISVHELIGVIWQIEIIS